MRSFTRAGALSPSELARVLRIDQSERWRLGQRIPATAYLNDHQALMADPEAAFELIYGEFLLREDLGEAPTIDEYLRDYPQYADRLRTQFELHRALAGDTTAIGRPTVFPLSGFSPSTAVRPDGRG